MEFDLLAHIQNMLETCLVCKRSHLYTFGDHAENYMHYLGSKYGHDHMWDSVPFGEHGYTWRRRLVDFLNDPKEGRSTLCLVDVLIYNWYECKHACVYIIGVSPMVGFGHRVFEVGKASTDVTLEKLEKHEGACLVN